MEKVKVSREVALAAENLMHSDTITEIFNWVTADYETTNGNLNVLKSWNVERTDEGEGLMKLLMGHYEIEQTPQEKLKEFFDELHYDNTKFAVKRTLEILNIKVSGVND